MKDIDITMYSTLWCGDCIRAKDWLDKHNIVYKEINIEENEKAMEYVRQINNGYSSVPTILFSDGSILVEPSNNVLEKKVKKLGLLLPN